MSSVLALNAKPSTPTCLSFTTQSARRIFSRNTSMRRLFTRSASLSMLKSTPARSASRMNAWTSLGKQKPPNPSPASKNRGPMRGSSPIARVTSLISALTFSHRSAIIFAYEIFTARNEFDACFISSALLIVVTTSFGGCIEGQAPMCTGQRNRPSRTGR